MYLDHKYDYNYMIIHDYDYTMLHVLHRHIDMDNMYVYDPYEYLAKKRSASLLL